MPRRRRERRGNKVTILTFTIGKNKIMGAIDARNLVTGVETWIPNPVLGECRSKPRLPATRTSAA